MKYYVIKVTQVKKKFPEQNYEWDKVGESFYHAGGRGNGAFANLYKEDQINRILGQYKSNRFSKHHVAEAVEVVFVEGTSEQGRDN